MTTRIETGTPLYAVAETSLRDATLKLHTVLVKQGGVKRIKVGWDGIPGIGGQYTVRDDGQLYPRKLFRTPEEAIQVYLTARLQAIGAAQRSLAVNMHLFDEASRLKETISTQKL